MLLKEDRIGPYRVEERIGAGGMGEVFRAWDERLDRPVALKRLRGATGADDERRRRFQLEARAAARLNHPSIVQLHDVLAHGDGEYLVMELVEGRTLRELIADGPLAPARAARLGAQIAAGLEAAHRQGVVHRDLKTENVIVTSEDQAKIVDFGIAKRLETSAEEASLTGTHAVLGTSRAMSPEQVCGETVDPRSDLFSLGTLLYECLAGRSPFVADTGEATRTNVLRHHPTPVHQVVTTVPRDFSDLIRHLLQKRPELRPRDAAEVVLSLERLAGTESGAVSDFDAGTTLLAPSRKRWPGFLAGVAVMVAVAVAVAGSLWLAWPAPDRPLYVAALEPPVTGEDREALMASSVQVATLRALASFEGVSVLALDSPTDGTEAITVASRALADELVRSRLSCLDEVCEVRLERLQVADRSTRWAERVEAPADDPRLLADAVMAALRRGFPRRDVRRGASRIEAELDDYVEFLRLRAGYSRRDRPLTELRTALTELRSHAPDFPEIALLEIKVSLFEYRESRQSAVLEHGRQLADRLTAATLDDPRPLRAGFRIALEAGELEQAAELLSQIEDLVPGDSAVAEGRAWLAEKRGEPELALEHMREAAERRPAQTILYNLANLEYRQGRYALARRNLEALLERFPEDRYAQGLLAQVELLGGSVERAAALLEELTARHEDLTSLTNLGVAQQLLRRYEQAHQSFRRAAGLLPDHPLLLLNLADSLLLLDREAEAREVYTRLIGFIEAGEEPPDWQLLTTKAQALAHLGDARRAVEAVQEALALRPGNPQAYLETALVYTVVGDRTSALLNAEKALDRGVAPRWLELPWFDPLRSDQAFAERLSDSVSSRR